MTDVNIVGMKKKGKDRCEWGESKKWDMFCNSKQVRKQTETEVQ
jgi:hypothetical protein